MRFFNKLGNVAFSQLFTYLLQQPIKDTLCGTKVLWRRDYERIAAARSVLRRLRSVRRLRPDLRGGPPEPEDRRDPGPLPRPHLRRDQHPALEARLVAAADVGGRRPQDQVRVTPAVRRTGATPHCRRVRARTLERFEEHRRAWAGERRAARAVRATGTGGSRPRCRRRRWGRRVELGSGPGFAREFIPGLELTDLVRAPWHDREGSAEALPFDDGSVGALVLFDVLHHLPSPRRVLRRGGARAGAGRPDRDVRAVRQPAVVSRLPLLHEEPLDMGVDPLALHGADGARDPFDSNQAIPTLLFGRKRAAFAAAFPALSIARVEHLAGLSIPGLGRLFARPVPALGAVVGVAPTRRAGAVGADALDGVSDARRAGTGLGAACSSVTSRSGSRRSAPRRGRRWAC